MLRTALLLCVLISTSLPAAGAASSAPNIVLIMADDMGYSDIGCYGSEIATPNLDRLAAGGLRFTQFYNTARCCPTRASLMTGLYAHQAGVGHMMGDRGVPGYRGDLARTSVTIAEVLGQAGYGTYMSGKWHLTRHVGLLTDEPELAGIHNWPRQRGFDAYLGTVHGGGCYFNPVLVRENEPVKLESDVYLTDTISDQAATYIAEHRKATPEKPFFVYVAYTAPHWPLHALPEDIEKFKGKYDGGWDELRERRYRRMIELGIIKPGWKLTPRDPNARSWEEVQHKQWQARRMEVYAAQVHSMDRGIGRIVSQLEASGALDNTLILFLADNGGCAEELRHNGFRSLSRPDKTREGRPMLHGNNPEVMPGPAETFQSYGLAWANASNTPFRLYKHWVHEGGISTPLIAHWPRVIKEKAKLTDQVGHAIDVMATCVELAGADYPSQYNGQAITPLQGKSLLPILQGRQREGHQAIFWEHEGNRAVRKGNWKLVSRHPGEWELYDLQADRSELNNLASAHPRKVAELSGLYEAWAARSNVVEWSKLRRGGK